MEDQGSQPPQPILGQQATWVQGRNEVREGRGRMRKVSLGGGRGGYNRKIPGVHSDQQMIIGRDRHLLYLTLLLPGLVSDCPGK